MFWETSDIDKYAIERSYVGELVVDDFTKRECTSHILKNLFGHVKTIIDGIGIYGSGKACFSDKKIMQMTAGIARELMYVPF